MFNLKTKCGIILIGSILIASFLGTIALKPNNRINRLNKNEKSSEVQNDFTLTNKSLRSAGAVPANFEWYRTCGRQWGDNGNGVALDSFGNVYFGGYTGYHFPQSFEMRLLKFNSTGHILLNITWKSEYGDYCHDLTVDSSDNVILGGTCIDDDDVCDYCIVKYDNQGVQKWNKTWGGERNEVINAVTTDSSGNIYAVGHKDESIYGDENITVFKLDPDGNFEWSTIWGGGPSDFGYAIDLDSSEDVIIGGYTTSFGAQKWDIVLIKYDKDNGEKLWNKTWGSSESELVKDLILDSEDNIFAVGYTSGFGAVNSDILFMKFNKTGDNEWYRLFGGTDYDIGNAIAMDSLNNIYIGGSFAAGGLKIIKYDYFGTQLWNETWGTTDDCNSLIIDSQKNIYCGGHTWTQGAGDSDMLLLKYNHSRPELTINAPVLNQVAGKKAPDFDVDVIDPYLNTSWYTINGSSLFHEFEGDIGTIDQEEWNLLDNGTFFLRFCANNSAGVENFKEVVIKRDTIDPIIIVNSPINGTGYYDPPSFNLTVLEPNLKSLEYTIDNGASNLSCSLLGVILPSLWEAAKYGNITIRFYAKDKGNNIGIAEVNVTKLLEEIITLLSDDDDGGEDGGSKDAIPGFQIVLLIITVISTSILLIKKKLIKT